MVVPYNFIVVPKALPRIAWKVILAKSSMGAFDSGLSHSSVPSPTFANSSNAKDDVLQQWPRVNFSLHLKHNLLSFLACLSISYVRPFPKGLEGVKACKHEVGVIEVFCEEQDLGE